MKDSSKAAQRRPARALAAAAVFALMGCPTGSAPTQPELAPESVAAAKPTYPGPPKAWSAMAPRERGQYMKDVVLPTMKTLFQAHDPKNFADFGCENCHGLEPQLRHFQMPNPELYALYPTGHPAQQQLVGRKREMATFMFNTVVPAMQQLLGQEPYNPQTHAGFSCFSCHPHGL